MAGGSINYVAAARDRLGHACFRMNELMQACGQFLASKPFSIERDLFDNLESVPSVRFRYRVTTLPPPRLGLLAGEVVHQLRATLDNLVWALGQEYPSSNDKAKNDELSFPVAESEEKFERLLAKPKYLGILDFPTAAQTTIFDAQSFRRSLDAPDLGLLHRLWNADKHKVPSVFITHSSGVFQDLDLRAPSSGSVGEIADGVIFLEGALPPQGIAADAAPRLTGVVMGINDPLLPSAKYAFLPLLYGHIQFVSSVIIRLEPLFPTDSRQAR